MNGLAVFPVRRDLQDGRTTQSAMGNQHFFAEGVMIGLRYDFRRNTRQATIASAIFAGQDKRHKRGPGLHDFQTELPRQFVAQRRCTHLGDRESARGNHQHRRTKFAGFVANNEFGSALHFPDSTLQKNLYSCGPAL